MRAEPIESDFRYSARWSKIHPPAAKKPGTTGGARPAGGRPATLPPPEGFCYLMPSSFFAHFERFRHLVGVRRRMTQAIAGVSPASVAETTIMTTWPSIGARPSGQALGRA